MNQLSKEELLKQLLGLNAGDLLELESTLQVMNKHKINRDSLQMQEETSKKIEEETDRTQEQESRENTDKESLVCMKCGCTEGIVKNGKRRSGKQKYKCKSCGHIFTEIENKVLSGTHKSMEVWERFIDCMNEELTLRKAAERCGIHRNTAFAWRHKVLNSLREDEEINLGGIVEADETYLNLSYKGNHKNAGEFENLYGRAARKRGGENHKRGLSNELACVGCGVDRQATSYAKVCGSGKASAEEIEAIFKGKVQAESVLCTDGLASYRSFAAKNKLQLEELPGGKEKRGAYHLNTVNSYHSIIKGFVGQFKGVATKYLNNYLVWCNWVKRKKMQDAQRIGLMLETVLSHIGKIRYCDVVLGAL